MTLLARGQQMLNRALGVAAGVSVTYTPKGGSPVTVTAWVGRTVFSRTQTETGAAVVFGDRDYLIPVAALAALGVAAPQAGDQVAETIAGTAVTFQVLPPEGGEPAWRFSDQSRTVYRLHTKRSG